MGVDRFEPVRAGIIGIWDYNEQIFRFAGGRLVLRGANGSGKTKALEVLVPFVFDGSIDARRLDPFSSKQRTMRSNLLYGDQKVGHGYCWLELAKGDETVTVGVGMRAQERGTGATTWFFVADGVVGEDIHLLSDNRVPLGRRELRGQLGTARVFDRRSDHQRAVDQRLFGLGPDRFEAMLELVLTLRRPQLAKDLDPDALSDVLSDGLRTVDEDLLRTSAQAFDNLESAQRDLSEMERAHQAVEELLVHWRTYLRARAAKRVARVEEMQDRVRRTEHGIAEKQLHIERKARQASAAERREQAHQAEIETLGASIEGLKRSSAYRNQHQLEDARDAARVAAVARDRTAAAAAAAAGRLSRATEGLESAEKNLNGANEQLQERQGELRALLRLVELPSERDVDPAALEADLIVRTTGADAVLEEVVRLEKAIGALSRAERALQKGIADLEQAEQRLSGAQEQLASRLSEAESGLRIWHEDLPADAAAMLELQPLLALVPELGASADLVDHVRTGLRPLRDRWIARRDELLRAAEEAEAAIERCSDEIEEIRAERQDAPPAPATRGASREGREGGPLWRLVRFRDDLSDQEQAGLEGALLASGLLDAWVSPEEPEPADGFSGEDSWLRPLGPVDGPSLLAVLEPEPAPGVPAAQIESILASIALGKAQVGVGADGFFALGPLVGHHQPARARYVGATARERHRAERIAHLERESERLGTELASLKAEAASVASDIAQLEQLPRALPSAKPARRARTELLQAETLRSRAQADKDAASGKRDRAARERDQARHAVRRSASEHGMPDDPEALRARRQHLEDAHSALGNYLRATEMVELHSTSRDDAVIRRDEADEVVRDAQRDLAVASAEHAKRKARLEAIEATLGEEIKQILAKIEALEGRLRQEKQSLEEASQDRIDAETAKASFVGEKNVLERQLPQQQQDLELAEAALRPFEQMDVQVALQVAEDDADFSARLAAAVRGASFSDEHMKSTETRLAKRLESLDQKLGSKFHSLRWTDDGITLVQVRDEMGAHGLSTFGGRLGDRLRLAKALLDQEEQKLFEDQLLGNLCGQMRERIDETRNLVQAMDRAMRARRLASRKSLGIAWRPVPDAPAERKELLQLLQVEPKLLGPERLQRIRQLLSDEVQAARQERPDREYLEILVDALNYRRWHRFELTLYEPDGSSHRLSKSRHSRLSGGEKAATLHLPLFAAAHAHFQAARQDCPRLVAMDEAFAGIDDTGVPELLRLAHEFDLDFFLTGYDLWVTEPFLPAVMHYDLVHDPVTRAVSAWPILWNGHETIEGRDADPWNAPS